MDEPAAKGVNILDLDQRVMQGIFDMSVVADFSTATFTPQELAAWFEEAAPGLGVEVKLLPMDQYQGRRRTQKNLYVVTILAKDRVGMVRDIGALAAQENINIERATLTTRGSSSP